MSFITFGEIMVRFTPIKQGEKIYSSRSFDLNFAGSESNVATSLSMLHNKVSFVTKLPENQLGDAAINAIKGYGINAHNIIRGDGRIGTYFIEIGSSIRPSSVIYDRAHSSFSQIEKGEFDWEDILKDKEWLFLSGITASLSNQCALESIAITKIAKKLGVKVCFDMNYRRTLWKSVTDARNIFDQIIENTDILFGNLGVLKDVYQMDYSDNSIEETVESMTKVQQKFGVSKIAFTVRDHISASENKLTGIIVSGTNHYISQTFNVLITDRFGTGDAFAAACMHGLNAGWNYQKTIEFAASAFALKHTIQGDQHTSTEKEILSIMEGNTSGHVLR
ncbi:sugar kinase [Flavobacterium sp. NG2]|uniref:sugar kinase n=1 Tax=Flavobacterium sp. NG2 TaxID=3097547 RepID=UPI002A823F50|nr:sugar kinase [Flavobacterium sp. NG2]WPR71098.1 sugar kinase [Flavobacterium sp. NG2]